MLPIMCLLFAGYVVLRCLEIWSVDMAHWSTPTIGAFMRIWAGMTCLGTIVLAVSVFSYAETLRGDLIAVLKSPATIETAVGVGALFLIGYGWRKGKRFRMKKLIARLNRQTVTDGIDLSRSLM